MLSVSGIRKAFGGVQALDNAVLRCDPGEIVGLIGPNGAGKSTLVNVVTGVLRPDAGTVVLGGRDLTGTGPGAICSAGIARTYQNLRVFHSLTVMQNVEVAHSRCRQLTPDRAARVSASALLKTFGLERHANALAGELSYGSQRRLEMARAMATVPQILLLDEPAAGLNDEETDQLGEVIRLVATQMGAGIVVIDHDLKFINDICRHLFVMDQGRPIAEGTPERVWKDPRVIEVYVGPGTETGTGDQRDTVQGV
ncbi:ABC transporter ATP-binding protein [Chachezhania sediminis]|uniref:ABC transporter ATP-binding protein n=1 Tax=Chachezhania sediminis TaxID=2599291 RepID=UPI00131E8827|nr:ABC transporter ATP-binding protein [Chachezhania sediminis]